MDKLDLFVLFGRVECGSREGFDNAVRVIVLGADVDAWFGFAVSVDSFDVSVEGFDDFGSGLQFGKVTLLHGSREVDLVEAEDSFVTCFADNLAHGLQLGHGDSATFATVFLFFFFFCFFDGIVLSLVIVCNELLCFDSNELECGSVEFELGFDKVGEFGTFDSE